MLSLDDVGSAVAEMSRGRDRGLVTAMLPVEPPGGTTYGDPRFERLWADRARSRRSPRFTVIGWAAR
jgi:hypothetical protein